jgi:hypothetical protein
MFCCVVFLTCGGLVPEELCPGIGTHSFKKITFLNRFKIVFKMLKFLGNPLNTTSLVGGEGGRVTENIPNE